MHLSNLLASAITLAPAVYGYGLAKVDITYHEACSNGEPPHNLVSQPESTVATADICSPLPAKHSFEIDAYAFKATPLTKDTTYTCHAVGIYSNDKCRGSPEAVIPLFPGEDEGHTPCVKDVYWERDLSVKLLCEHEHGHGHGHEHGHEERRMGSDEPEEEDRVMDWPEAEKLMQKDDAPETNDNDNLLGSFNLDG